MKLLKLLSTFAIIANLGCSHIEVSPSGFKATNTNLKKVVWTPQKFEAKEVNMSTPLNSTWRGVNGAIDRAGTAILPFAIPGGGTVPSLIKGGSVTIPRFVNPTSPSETILTR